MGLLPLLMRWASQGVVSFVVGLLPFFTTSRDVFVGALSTSVPEANAIGFLPVAAALIHIAGILSVLIAERRLSSRMLNSSPPDGLDSDAPPSPTVAAQNDMELRETEQTGGLAAQARPSTSRTARLGTLGPHQRRVYLFIFAFIVERIASGIGLGYAEMAPPWKPENVTSGDPSTLYALSLMIIHSIALVGEVATTLGFATTLLSASLPVAECKRHVLLYVAARPLAALLSYNVTILSRIIPSDDRPFIVAMNSFTGGIFVYAALVVRALIVNSRTTARSGLLARVFLMAAGALLPCILPVLVSVGRVWYAGKLKT
ncbi:hypothetical protein V8D89_004041 [Ganoderma adspersum]